MAYQNILYDVDEPVAVIRLNRPDRLNAWTDGMLDELRGAVSEACRDRRVVGIVITGEGRGFCAGLDAEALQSTHETGTRAPAAPRAPGRGPAAEPDSAAPDAAAPDAAAPDAAAPGLFTHLMAAEKPVIAAVNGAAAGGGFVLACLCDIRFASTDARFTPVFSKRGLVPEFGATWIMPRLMSLGSAMDMLWTSRMVGADEAHRIGLVQYVTAPAELVPSAIEYVRELAATVSPASLYDAKRLLYRHAAAAYEIAIREADEATKASIGRPDAVEGAQSFVERRPPDFPRLGED